MGHDSVLHGADSSHLVVGSGALFPHTGNKSTLGRGDPLFGPVAPSLSPPFTPGRFTAPEALPLLLPFGWRRSLA
jgi:hypothetical protein